MENPQKQVWVGLGHPELIQNSYLEFWLEIGHYLSTDITRVFLMILLTPMHSFLNNIRYQRMILGSKTTSYVAGFLRKSELDLMKSVDCKDLASLESGVWCIESFCVKNSICWWFGKLSAADSVPYMPNRSTGLLSLSSDLCPTPLRLKFLVQF